MQKILLLRIIASRPRLFIGYGLGLLSYFLLTLVHSVAFRAALAWDIGSAIFLLLTAILFIQSDHTNISRMAAAQQEGEWSVFALTLVGAVMSFIAIIAFSNSGDHKSARPLYLAFVISTLLLSWLTTHVSFAYRYAHEYYSRDRAAKSPGGVERGIVFPGEENPDYMDFIYFSFVLGMTFQVSDVNITAKKFRRLATLQGMIGFVFNTVILALSVNIAASVI